MSGVSWGAPQYYPPGEYPAGYHSNARLYAQGVREWSEKNDSNRVATTHSPAEAWRAGQNMHRQAQGMGSLSRAVCRVYNYATGQCIGGKRKTKRSKKQRSKSRKLRR